MDTMSNILEAIKIVNKGTGADPKANPSPPAAPANVPISTGARPPAPAPAPVKEVNVLELLEQKAKNSPEKGLDYKKSIVDLLKLLNLDSSLTARKKLADELGYTGDKSDSATMNVWLIKEVMNRLAENGGEFNRRPSGGQNMA